MKYISRVLYILIFLVMVTSPYAGHTYAEYARVATGEDQARITKFGVTVTATESTFAATYGTTVASANGTDKVIAPGTSGTFVAFTASGRPEVRTKVTKNATVTMSDNWTTTNGLFYCPLVFTVQNKSGAKITTIKGLDYDDKETLIADLQAALLLDNGKEYGTNYSYDTNAEHNRTVTWEWPYVGATGTNSNNLSQTEENDNALGNKDVKPTISVAFDIYIEQID